MNKADSQSELLDFPPHLPLALRNRTCVYCGLALMPRDRTREHVIGRCFVPDGKLQGQWNLILNACRPCNSHKADLEDDISAITLQPDSWGAHGHADVAAIENGHRKAVHSRSRRTRKSVRDSGERINIHGSLGPGIHVSFQFASPPQIDDHRAFELARLQLTAFFYMQTYNSETRQGGYWLHGYHPIMTANRSDWGNPLMVRFMRTIESWDCRLHAVTADGFFKLVTRKHPLAETWAWALEWNHNRRLIGFFGERDPAQDIVNSLPRLEAKTVYQAPNESLSYRVETPLGEDDDTLFLVFDDETALPDD
ncbi:MAG: hypothetical protein EOR69_28505 [Mesorhizobium sp.]|nr:MAG: hypothetical protein EOR69_28505 [Mesorhizobium sp.]RWL95344.1 MAG: hypothetical protein EOR70_22505 [Mesorhizobium sp.]